jgi:hypothetical protein
MMSAGGMVGMAWPEGIVWSCWSSSEEKTIYYIIFLYAKADGTYY